MRLIPLYYASRGLVPIMISNTEKSSPDRPDVFSRGALELTFKLLRKQNPRLALDVQNQLQGLATLREVTEQVPARKVSDHFHITLDAQTIGKVVEALTALGQNLLDNSPKDNGTLVVVRSLIKDWIELAEWVLVNAEDPHSQTLH